MLGNKTKEGASGLIKGIWLLPLFIQPNQNDTRSITYAKVNNSHADS